MLRDAEPAAKAFKVELQYLDVGGLQDIETVFREARKKRADAVLVLASPILESYRTEVATQAVKNRLATMFWASETVESGGLMSYGANVADLYRRAAPSWTRFSKEPSQPICRWSNRRSSSS